MAQFSVFTYYSYANAVNQTLQTILELPQSNFGIDPLLVSHLQLQTVSLPDLGEDFLEIKEILSFINNLLALWVHTGIPKDFELIFIAILLVLSLELLFTNYNNLANESGLDFNRDQLEFILVTKSLLDLLNNGRRLIKSSSVMNLVVNDKEKLVESVLGFGNLSSKFSHDDVLRVIAELN